MEAIDRRVLGVLVEKAKTTPSSYPLTLNAIKSGANQKSNRYPQMQLDDDQLEESLDRLRECKAVSFVQGDGRVQKYRHLAYDWLGVSKVELAVMAELLLRGAQTVGELRGRANRMEPIPGMSQLGPLVDGLLAKSLLIYLTPPGRGASVTHHLYLPRELEKVQRDFGGTATPSPAPPFSALPPAPASLPAEAPVASVIDRPSATSPAATEDLAPLRREMADLRASLAEFRSEAESSIESLRAEVADLNRQLGN